MDVGNECWASGPRIGKWRGYFALLLFSGVCSKYCCWTNIGSTIYEQFGAGLTENDIFVRPRMKHADGDVASQLRPNLTRLVLRE